MILMRTLKVHQCYIKLKGRIVQKRAEDSVFEQKAQYTV